MVDLFVLFFKDPLCVCGNFIVLHAFSIYKVENVVLQRVGRLTTVMMTAVTQMQMTPVWTRSPKHHGIHQRVVAANPAVLSTDPEVQRSCGYLVFSWPLTTSVWQQSTVCTTGRQNASHFFFCSFYQMFFFCIFCTDFSVQDINPNLCWSSYVVFTISLRAFSPSRCLLVNGQQLWRLSPLVRHTQCWWEGRLCVCQPLWRPSQRSSPSSV